MALGKRREFESERAAVGPGMVVLVLVQGEKEKRQNETGWAGYEVGAASDGDSERKKKGNKICSI